MKPINTLSTFNGMGCIWYALKRAGIPMGKCYSSEIDKYANQANDIVFPDTIQLGDVTKWREWNIDWGSIDFFAGGSPCTGFSFAGKMLNFSDPQSRLFFEYVAIWNHIKKHNPNAKFLLENVNMKKEYLRVISEYLGVFPVRINSNRVSAQNRDRWYWSNIRTKDVGLFSELWTDIPQPEDKGILLDTILEPIETIDEKYHLNDVKRFFESKLSPEQQLKILNTDTFCVETINRFIKGKKVGVESQINIDKSPCIKATQSVYVGVFDKNLKKKNSQDKSGCLSAGGNSGGNHSDMDVLVYIKDNVIFRRLTPREVGYLQTFTKEEMDVLLASGISDTQLYKQFGNGWTIEVIAWILSFMK